MTTETTTPFGTAAKEYYAKGWQPLPITRPGMKDPVPAGYTGHRGQNVNERDISNWTLIFGQGPYNIAVRVNENALGIDVDAYPGKPGAETLADWEAAVGSPLPPTWRSSARLTGDSVSGIRHYQLPEGVDTSEWIGGAPGIELIRHCHRYALVSPSRNPDAGGAPYQWLDESTGEITDIPPMFDSLPSLPRPWVDFLAGLRPDKVEMGPLPPSTDAVCGVVQQAVTSAIEAMNRGTSRHDTIRDAVAQVYRAARNGHSGHGDALRILRHQLFSRRGADDTDERSVDGEWQRIVEGAQALVGRDDQQPPCICHNEQLNEWAREHAVTDEPPQPEPVETPHTSRLRKGDGLVRNTTIPWLVEGVLHEKGLGQLAAPEDTGKSIISIDLALSIANGLPEWAGYRIRRPGPVVYVAMEGGPVIESYINSWLGAHAGCNGDNLYLLDEEELNFTDDKTVAWLERDIDIEGIEPVLVVFDTQIDVTGATDEMKPEMGQMLAKVRRWLVARGAFGLLLHHPPYGEKRGRGSTSVRGKADVLVYADKDTSMVSWQKVKGAVKPAPFRFQIDRGPVVWYPGAPGLSELAATEAAQEADESIAKERRTRAAILEILTGESPKMLREKNPTSGWSDAELRTALEARSTRSADEGGQSDVHTHKKYVTPIMKALTDGETPSVVDNAVSWTSGQQREWALNPKRAPKAGTGAMARFGRKAGTGFLP
jgi:hypothetical protein